MPTTRTYLDYLNEKVDIAPANSQEELEAAEMLGSLMQEHGLEVQMQDFDTSASGKLAHYGLHVVMFVGMLLSGFINTPVGLIGMLLAVAAFALLMLERNGRDYLSNLGPRARSQNVIGVHRASGPLVMKGNRPVVIVAHYDTPNEGLLYRPQVSKYQPLVYRLCFPCSVAVAVCAFFQILGFVPEGFRHFLLLIGLVSGLPLLATGVAAIYARFAPCTEGANDNKSSVAALLGVMDMVRPANDEAKRYLALHPHVAPERDLDPASYVPTGYDEAPADDADALAADAPVDDLPAEPAAADPLPEDDFAERSMPALDDGSAYEGQPLSADDAPVAEVQPEGESFEPAAGPESQPAAEDGLATEPAPAAEPEPAPVADEPIATEPAAEPESDLMPGLTEIPTIDPAATAEPAEAPAPAAEHGDPFGGNVRRGADFVRGLSILPEGCDIVYAEPELPELDLSGLPEVPEMPVFDPEAMAHGESGVMQPPAQDAPLGTITPDDLAAGARDAEYDEYGDEPHDYDDFAEQRYDGRYIHYVTYDEQVPIAEVEPFDGSDESVSTDAAATTDAPVDGSPLAGLKAAWGRVVDGFKNRGNAGQDADADAAPADAAPADAAPATDDAPETAAPASDADGTGEVVPFSSADDAAADAAATTDDAPEPDATRPMPAAGIEVDPSAGTTAAASANASKTLVDQFASDARGVESIPTSDDAPSAEKSVDPHATIAMSALTFSTEQDVPEEELASKDVTGLDTLSVDGLNLKRPAEERVKPAAIEDPSWGRSDFTPPQQSLGRRAILFDLPDPSRDATDPFLSDPDSTTPDGQAVSVPPMPQQPVAPEPTPAPAPAPEPAAPQPDGLEVIHGDAAPAPAAPQPGKGHGLRSLFGRKKSNEVESMSDWLGVEDDYDAKKNGREIGNWKNFENDDNGGWKGGAARRSGLRDDAEAEPIAEGTPLDEAPMDAYVDAPYDEQGFEAAPFDEVIDAAPAEPEPAQQPAQAEYLTPEEAAAQADGELAPPPTDDDLREAILGMSDDELLAHDIWFVATGASSLDHAGIKTFLDEHRKDVRGAFVVNLECIGAGSLNILSQEGEGAPRRADRRMGRLLLNIAKDLHLNLDHARFDWADTEATPAMRARMRATTIMGLDENGVPALSHTPTDVEVNVDPDRPTRVAEMVAELIRRA